jgi:hypothetical protein
MKSVRDDITPEQRARLGARAARELAKPPSKDVLCAYCEKFVANFEVAGAPNPEDLLASGMVPVPNFGWFCCHDCADAYERDYGIRFKRDASGKVCYY